MITIGVDCSLKKIGVVAISETFEVVKVQTIEPEITLSLVERMNHVYQAIKVFLKEFTPEEIEGIFFEALAFNAQGRIGDLGGCHHVARLGCYHWWTSQEPRKFLVLEDIPSTQVRKRILGSKPPMSKELKKQGMDVKGWIEMRMKELSLPVLGNDHERDAYLTARAGVEWKSISAEGKAQRELKKAAKRKKALKEKSQGEKPVKKTSTSQKSLTLF